MDYPITLESFKDVGPILKDLNLATHQNALYLETGEMTTLKLDLMQSFAVALLVYYLGVLLKKKIAILNKFCIPAPVAGGVVFALLHLIVRETMHFSLGIDTTFQTPFMLVFFTKLGITESIKLIKKVDLVL